jgi:soluble lytic murein transglycosylase
LKKRSWFFTILIFFLFGSCPPRVVWGGSDSPVLQFEKARDLFKQAEYARALAILQRLEEASPDPSLRPEIAFLTGQTLRSLRKWPEAAREFSLAGEIFPLLADYALFYQGEAWGEAGETEKSLDAFQRLVTLYPQSLPALRGGSGMAKIYLARGEFEKAAGVSRNLLASPSFQDYAARALFLLGQAQEGMEKWREALATYRKIWLEYPLQPAARKAEERRNRLLQEKGISPEVIPPRQLLARALKFFQAHLYETALGEMNRIEGFPPEAFPPTYQGDRWVDDLYFHRGLCFFRLKQYEKAAETFQLILYQSQNDETAEKSLYWLMRALLRCGRAEEAAGFYPLLRSAYPQSTLLDRALFLQAYIREDEGDRGKAVSFYQEVADKFPSSALRSSALWKIGWLSYKAGDYPRALKAWEDLLASASRPLWVEKGLYWKARVLEKTGQFQEAKETQQQLKKEYPASFYTQMIFQGTASQGGDGKNWRPLEEQSLPVFFEIQAKSAGADNLHFEKGKKLVQLGMLSPALQELQAAEEEGERIEEMQLEVARLYREAGEYHRSNFLVRKHFPLKPFTGDLKENDRLLFLLAYPLGKATVINHFARMRKLDPAFLSAVILEESRFQDAALSAAGARGWMQILPSTGRKIARQLKLQSFSDELLFDAKVNLRLGSWYLSRLLEEFGGKETLALAAYNAGPQIVREWLAQNPDLAEDEFVEEIPYPETKNYVIRVMTSTQIYRALYRSRGTP